MRGRKNDKGKMRPSLLPARALKLVAQVFTEGLGKDGRQPEDWMYVEDPRRYLDAAMRHILEELESVQRYRDTSLDKETGVYHLAHAVASLMIAIELVITYGYVVEYDEEGKERSQ